MINILGRVSVKPREKGSKKITTFEIDVDGTHRLIDADLLKRKSGARRYDQTSKMEKWLETDEGQEFLATTKDDISYFIALYGSRDNMMKKIVEFLKEHPTIAIGPTMKALVEKENER